MYNPLLKIGVQLAAVLAILTMPAAALAQLYSRPVAYPVPPPPPRVTYYEPSGQVITYYPPPPLVVPGARYSFYDPPSLMPIYPITTSKYYQPGMPVEYYYQLPSYTPGYYSGYYTPGYFRY
jgi:hypothetical protein